MRHDDVGGKEDVVQTAHGLSVRIRLDMAGAEAGAWELLAGGGLGIDAMSKEDANA